MTKPERCYHSFHETCVCPRCGENERIDQLEAENERLREALERVADDAGITWQRAVARKTLAALAALPQQEGER